MFQKSPGELVADNLDSCKSKFRCHRKLLRVLPGFPRTFALKISGASFVEAPYLCDFAPFEFSEAAASFRASSGRNGPVGQFAGCSWCLSENPVAQAKTL